MWTIGEVKSEAWNKLKNYYWPAFAVVIIWAILGGEGNGSGIREGVKNREYFTGQYEFFSPGSRYMIFLTILGFVAAVTLLLIVLKIFVGNPVEVGKNRFFMESRELGRSAGIEKAFWVFKSGHYMNVVKIMFLRDLYTGLWYLLLIIPGIIKSYEYTMISYILSENPEANTKEVFIATKEMMDDSKFQLFCLELSFIGWYLLGVLLCLVGVVFVIPYEQASIAEVYAMLRKRAKELPLRGYVQKENENQWETEYKNEYDNDNWN